MPIETLGWLIGLAAIGVAGVMTAFRVHRLEDRIIDLEWRANLRTLNK